MVLPGQCAQQLRHDFGVAFDLGTFRDQFLRCRAGCTGKRLQVGLPDVHVAAVLPDPLAQRNWALRALDLIDEESGPDIIS